MVKNTILANGIPKNLNHIEMLSYLKSKKWSFFYPQKIKDPKSLELFLNMTTIPPTPDTKKWEKTNRNEIM